MPGEYQQTQETGVDCWELAASFDGRSGIGCTSKRRQVGIQLRWLARSLGRRGRGEAGGQAVPETRRKGDGKNSGQEPADVRRSRDRRLFTFIKGWPISPYVYLSSHQPISQPLYICFICYWRPYTEIHFYPQEREKCNTKPVLRTTSSRLYSNPV